MMINKLCLSVGCGLSSVSVCFCVSRRQRERERDREIYKESSHIPSLFNHLHSTHTYTHTFTLTQSLSVLSPYIHLDNPKKKKKIKMKIFTIAATALLAAVAYAAPALVEARNPVSVEVEFIGAAGPHFVQYFPADDSLQEICMFLFFFLFFLFPLSSTTLLNMILKFFFADKIFVEKKKNKANVLSISKIHVIPSGYTGVFYGIDGSVTTVVGPGTTDVGPPQTQVSGKVHVTPK